MTITQPDRATAVAAAAAANDVRAYTDAQTLCGDGRLRAQLDANRWQAPTRGVVVLHNGPLTEDQRMWVALLAAPPGTVLGELSAARHDSLKGFEPDGLRLVVPGSSRNPHIRQHFPEDWNVKLKWSTELGPDDVNPAAIPPRTRLARSVVDAASERVPKRWSRVLILAPVQQRLLPTDWLWDTLSRRGNCRNRAIIVESIRDAEGGIQSLPEQEFDAIRARWRLPEPTRQTVLKRKDGRYYLDSEWTKYGVRTEIHDIPHLLLQNWDQDLLRQNDVSIAGDGLLVFSSYAIHHSEHRVGDQLDRMLRSRGYRG